MKNTPLLQNGFTLIEVAVVVALLTVLALVAMPSYTNYLKKSQVAEGINLATDAKLAVTDYVTENKPLESTWKPPTPNNTVSNINIHLTETTGISSAAQGRLVNNLPAHYPGEIVIVFSPKVAPKRRNELILSPRRADPNKSVNDGHELPLELKYSPMLFITWECNSASPPSTNRGSRGNLEAKYVPADCRT